MNWFSTLTPVKLTVLTVFLLPVFLNGCSPSVKTRVDSQEEYIQADCSLEEHACLLGRVWSTDCFLLMTSVKKAGFWIRRIPCDKDGKYPVIADEIVLSNSEKYEDIFIYGETTRYCLKPGKYIILPYEIVAGGNEYDLVGSPKKTAFGKGASMVSASLGYDYELGRGKKGEIHLGEIELKAGEVVYFGDIFVGSPKYFITYGHGDFNDDFEVVRLLKKTAPELLDKMQFKPFTGRVF